MGLPTFGRDDGGGGLVVGGDVYFPPPEPNFTVHRDQTNYGYLSGGGAAPWGAGLPKVAGLGEILPWGDEGSGKCGVYGGYGGRGLWRQVRLMQRYYCSDLIH